MAVAVVEAVAFGVGVIVEELVRATTTAQFSGRIVVVDVVMFKITEVDSSACSICDGDSLGGGRIVCCWLSIGWCFLVWKEVVWHMPCSSRAF